MLKNFCMMVQDFLRMSKLEMANRLRQSIAHKLQTSQTHENLSLSVENI